MPTILTGGCSKFADRCQLECTEPWKTMDMRIIISDNGRPSPDALGLAYEQNANQTE